MTGALLVAVLGAALAAPLTPARVAAAVDARVPELAAAEADVAAAEGKLLGTRGSLDPTLKAGVASEVTGPYPNLTHEAGLVLPTGLGPDLSLRHRRGIGDFAVYDGKQQTLDGGEVRLGLSAPLLQDLGMPADRAARLVAAQGVDAAAAGLEARRQALVGRAVQHLHRWTATGEKLDLAGELLSLAEGRQGGIERQVALGALPELEAVDNGQVVLARRSAQRQAEVEHLAAGLALAYFLRGPDRAPTPPDPADRPAPAAGPPGAPTPDPEPLVAQALAARPELRVLDALIAAADVERRRAASRVLPRLDAAAGVARDLGAGDPKLGKTEVDAGLTLTVPLLARKGRGELARTRAVLDRLQAERRGRQDTVALEVQALVAQRRAAAERWALAEAAATRAAEVLALERRAFELGDSDIFKLNKREETLAEARKDLIEARLDWHLADTALTTATAAW